MHLFIDALLSEVPELSVACMQLLIKIIKANQLGIYIPGKTLNAEKNRAIIIRHGLICALLHISLQKTDSSLKGMAGENVRNIFNLRELEWNFEMIDFLLKKSLNFYNTTRFPTITDSTHTNVLEKLPKVFPSPYINSFEYSTMTDFGRQFDTYSDKGLTLSKYAEIY